MILKLKKKAYEQEKASFAVTNEFGEFIAIVSKVKKGFYITNRDGERIGQIAFNKQQAKVEVANDRYDDVLTVLTQMPDGRFLIEGASLFDALDNAGQPILSNRYEDKISIWGNPNTYSYDMFSGNKKAASVSTYVKSPAILAVSIEGSYNVLRILMIILAIDYFAKPIALDFYEIKTHQEEEYEPEITDIPMARTQQTTTGEPRIRLSKEEMKRASRRR